MSQQAEPASNTQAAEDGQIVASAGNYELIHGRLSERGAELRAAVTALNQRREETFGRTELTVTANARVRTHNNCVPRDIVQVGGCLVFGYNVFLGLRQETSVEDVFSVQRIDLGAEEADFHPLELSEALGGFLADATFVKDFNNLYRYYREAWLDRLALTDSFLLAIFRIGKSEGDIKVFRWRLNKNGQPTYVDDRGIGDMVIPATHDFKWQPTTREMQVHGEHPHINIEDIVFVETMGGDLTIKVENNTKSGRGIYSEPVEDDYQTLDDGEIRYALIGHLVLLSMQPYREQQVRYLVYNQRTQKVARIDGIGQSCVQLPEEHGIIFPGGYYLQSGEYKVFDHSTEGLRFHRAVHSPNGEDVLYVFYMGASGGYTLLAYNLIRKEVRSPIYVDGYSLFEDGRMVVFRRVGDEATRVHPMQVWQTPFVSLEIAASQATGGSYLTNVGNGELVRGISDLYSICRLIEAATPTRQGYEDLIASLERVSSAYYWLDHAEIALKKILGELGHIAEAVIDEFEKVVALRARAEQAISQAKTHHTEVLRAVRAENFSRAEGYLSALRQLDILRGELTGLEEIRYIDVSTLAALQAETTENFDRISRECVQFMLRPDALGPLQAQLEALLKKIEGAESGREIGPLREELAASGEGLDLLREVISNLQIEDPIARAQILEGLSELLGQRNQVRESLESRRRSLFSKEGRIEFAAQFKLFGQSLSSALGMCETPERCDEEQARLMVQLEELEGRFSEFDEFLVDLAGKREEVLAAFGARRQQLIEERQRRAANILAAADRIFEGIARRVRSFSDVGELHTYFAGDAMVRKLDQLAQQLEAIREGDRAQALRGRIKAERQEALRSLRDKKDLYVGEGDLIQFGQHRFSVNTQSLELSLVPHQGGQAFHLTGTDFYEPVEEASFLETQAYWAQSLVSEDAEVYRGEYLAASLLWAAERGEGGHSIAGLLDAKKQDRGLLRLLRAFAQQRYDEGYERGLHDTDAARILEKLLDMRAVAGLLRFAPTCRAFALLFWQLWPDHRTKTRWQRNAQSLGRLRRILDQGEALQRLAADLSERMLTVLESPAWRPLAPQLMPCVALAGSYLVEELSAEHLSFTTSRAAIDRVEALWTHLEHRDGRRAFEQDLQVLVVDRVAQVQLALAWLQALGRQLGWPEDEGLDLEAAVIIALGDDPSRQASSAVTEATLEGMLGRHARIIDGEMHLRLDAFTSRLSHFERVTVPGFRAYQRQRRALVAEREKALRLDELKPKIMSSFVRNKLISEVYLPLIGHNLAKQMGAVGANKRTDLMGLLLLTSPPGYGKTTLMEYVAQRLGLVFVKVNGPSLGHEVHGLDPRQVADSTARQEVEKVNLAFEMGSNVMLYLDDVQHLSPMFLQKFISLCDAQRRIEGVWRGRTRTYDLRGKKFCIVMAGNPYTESGEKFVIPDMLANRADIYNLGEILTGSQASFELSYLENALTSNTVLAPLAGRGLEDVYKLIAMADGMPVASTELEYGYASVEVDEIVSVFKKLRKAQAVLLAVNKAYVDSANIDDRFRTEPPFKLQGSYRNMSKIAERVVSAMNDEELEALIDDHYRGESQTLTSGAEDNLLRLNELRGRLSPEEAERLEQVRRSFRRIQTAGGSEEDPMVRMTGTLAGVVEQLDRLGDHFSHSGAQQGPALAQIAEQLHGLPEALRGIGPSEQAFTPMAAQLGQIAQALDSLRLEGAPAAQEEIVAQLRGLREAVQAMRGAGAAGAQRGGPAQGERGGPPPLPAQALGRGGPSADTQAIVRRLDALVEVLRAGERGGRLPFGGGEVGVGGLRPFGGLGGGPPPLSLQKQRGQRAETPVQDEKLAQVLGELSAAIQGLGQLGAAASPEWEQRVLPVVQRAAASRSELRVLKEQVERLALVVAQLELVRKGT